MNNIIETRQASGSYNIKWHYLIPLIPTFVVLLITSGTLHQSPDSFHYEADFLPYWPPLYGFLLQYSPFSPNITGFLTNIASYSVILTIIGKLSNKTYTKWAIMATLLSIPLVFVSTRMWSEMLFIAFCMMFLESKNEKTIWISGALAMLTRYTGIVLLPIGLWKHRGNIKKQFVYLTSAVPLGIWLVRNKILYGTLTGTRHSSVETIWTLVEKAWQVISSWFVGDSILIIPLLIVAIVLIRPNLKGINLDVVIFSAVYLVFMITSSLLVKYDELDSRLLAPIFPVIIIGMSYVLDQIPLNKKLVKVLAYAWLLAPFKVIILWMLK